MKNTKYLVNIMAAGGLLMALADSTAAQLEGSIAIQGGVDLDSNNVGAATRVDSWVDPKVTSSSGDFSSYVTTGESVAMSSPWNVSSPIAALWSVGGFTFDLHFSEVAFQNSSFLSVRGTGIISGNGFDATEGVFFFTTQEPDSQGIFSFSASSRAVPVLGELGDFVWGDVNANGIQDSGEAGINGVQVNLLDCADNVLASTSTANHPISNEPGYYLFTDLDSGCYRVEFVLPAGYVFSPADTNGNADDAVDSDPDPSTGITGDISLSPGESDLTWDAGIYQLASLGDFVWLDSNENGIQEVGEAGVENVTVNLYICGEDMPVATTQTGAGGTYLFSDLFPGDYSVEFILPAGFTFTAQDQGGDDALDSDANPSNGQTVCTTLVSGENDLSWDAGLVQPCPPGLEFDKIALTPKILPGGAATYKYVVRNTGCTPLTDIEIVDDNATPGFEDDDFVVGTVDFLSPGDETEFVIEVYPPVELCGPEAGGSTEAGVLITEELPNGDIKVTFIQSFNRNDNTYGINSIGWKVNRPHRFKDLLNSDHVVFRVTNANGNEVLRFAQDYISASAAYPSGYGTLGVSGGDGGMFVGSASSLYGFGSSLGDNLNKEPFLSNLAQYLVDSPALSDPNTAEWEYHMIYSFVAKAEAFGSAGFGGVSVVDQHNSPPKSGDDSFTPKPCGGCVVNLATVTANSGGTVLSSTDTAEVCFKEQKDPCKDWHCKDRDCKDHGDKDDCRKWDCKDRDCKDHGDKDRCKKWDCKDRYCKDHGDKGKECKQWNCKDRDCDTHGDKDRCKKWDCKDRYCKEHGDKGKECKQWNCKDRDCNTHGDKDKDRCKKWDCKDRYCKDHGDKSKECKQWNCKDRDCKAHGDKGWGDKDDKKDKDDDKYGGKSLLDKLLGLFW